MKNEKIADLKKAIESYNQMLERAGQLKTALGDYNRETINKIFFEKYFTLKETNGDIRKDWKGNIYTGFSFMGRQYSFDKYEKRLFLFNSQYVEVNDTSKTEVLRATDKKISIINLWIENAGKHLSEVESTDEQAITAELIAIYKKYNNPSMWTEILESYEVRYPKEK